MKKVVCLLLAFSVMLSANFIDASAMDNSETIVADRISFCDEKGQLVSGIPDSGTMVYAVLTASDLQEKDSKEMLWIAGYKNGVLKSFVKDEKGTDKITEFKSGIAVSDDIDEIRAGFWGDGLQTFSSLRRLNKNGKGVPGELLNVKWKGAATDAVYGGLLKLMPVINLVKGNDGDASKLAAVRKLAGTVYASNNSQQYTNRTLEDFSKDNVGYSYKFTLADKGETSVFGKDGVTILHKKDNLKKTGAVGTVTELKSANDVAVYAVPSLGAEPEHTYEKYSTDEERINAVCSTTENPYYYTNGEYAIFTNRNSGTAWNYKANDIYGGQSEFTIIDDPHSALISPDVTRIYKPSNDKENSDKAYSFKISKGATVYITVMERTAFLDSFKDKGWEYEYDEKYKVYHSGYILATASDSVTKYRILTGYPQLMQCAKGGVYKKHFSKNETVEIPSYSSVATDKTMGIFIVWDECNDETEIFGLSYQNGAEEKEISGYNEKVNEYYVLLPESTSTVPTVKLNATGAVKYSVTRANGFDSEGKAESVVSISGGRSIKVIFVKEPEDEKNAFVDSVAFGETVFNEFNACVTEYSVDIYASDDYPTVSASTRISGTKVEIVQPSENNNGVCTITSTVAKQNSKVYKITFNRLAVDKTEAQVMRIKDNKKAIVTIVHDDGTLDTVDYMNGELEKNGLKSTIAMIGSYVTDDNVAKWQSYLDTGRFNIANHSYNHRYWGQSDVAESGIRSDGGKFDNPEGTMTNEIVTSGEYLRKMFPKESVLCFVKPGFTYPSGKAQVSAEAYEMITKNYICMRNTGGGVESIMPGDWSNVKSYMVSPNDTAQTWTKLIDEAIENNGWIVYLFHQIKETGGGNTVEKNKATEFFAYAGEKVNKNEIWCAFMDEATMYLKEYDALESVSAYYNAADQKVTVELSDTLDNSIYDYPLTVKVELPEQWTKAKLTQGARTEEYEAFLENGKTYIYANVVPDISAAEITKNN